MLSKELLLKFKSMYKEDYGVDLSDVEAYRLFTELVEVVKIVCNNN